jgi:hypothetical protein
MGFEEDTEAEARSRNEGRIEALEWALRRIDGVSATCAERIQIGLFRLKRGEGLGAMAPVGVGPVAMSTTSNA